MRSRRVLALVLLCSASMPLTFAAVTRSGAATAPALDHFQCYAATAKATGVAPVPFPATPAKVLLKNSFASSAFTATPGAVQMHCNPVQKTVTSGGHTVTTPITNAAAHLLCRATTAKGVKLPASLTVKNQFGTGALKPTAVRSLCMPSWTATTTPLKFPTAKSPATLDAFVCYTVTHPNGTPSFKPPASAKLKDQFGTATTKVGAAGILCVPSSETANLAGPSPKIVNPTRYSVCFSVPAPKTVTARTVYDKNQFGIGAVKVASQTQLCVPSLKVVVAPPTTTTTTTPAPPAVIKNYSGVGISAPYDIVTGSDGALWFSNYTNNSIGRITTDGTVTNFTDPSISNPDGLAEGPDGAVWFANTGNNSIGRIATDGTVVNHADSSISKPYRITAGPDGALWFTNGVGNSIGRMTTSGSVVAHPHAGISNPQGITTGPDGALWFCNFYGSSIERVTTSGTFTDYKSYFTAYPESITTGPDGALWFTSPGINAIGRITTSGVITSYSDDTISSPVDITTGSDGALWFTNYDTNSIGRITTHGQINNYSDPSISSPNGIEAGPDGAVWFVNSGNNTIGRIEF